MAIIGEFMKHGVAMYDDELLLLTWDCYVVATRVF